MYRCVAVLSSGFQEVSIGCNASVNLGAIVYHLDALLIQILYIKKGPDQSSKRCFSRLPVCSVPFRTVVPTDAGLSNIIKCHSSLHHSHPCSSFLVLWFPRIPISMLRIVASRGVGYACCRFYHAFFGRCLICWYCV